MSLRHRKRGHILMTDQLDTGIAGIFSRRTKQTQEARVYSRAGGRTTTTTTTTTTTSTTSS
eukprot:175074-Prorocentrum_minimum.AAC.1